MRVIVPPNAAALSLQAGAVFDLNPERLNLADGATVSTYTDPSPGRNNVTAGGAIYKAAGWSDGGPCLLFDGAHYLTVSSLSSLYATNPVYTVAAWIRRGVAGVVQSVFSLGSGNPSVNHYLSSSNNACTLAYNNAGGYVGFDVGTLVLTTEDEFVVWVVNGASSGVYVNGQFTSASLAGLGAVSGASVGYVGVGTAMFNGLIRRLGVWNRAFTDADYMALASQWGVKNAGLRYKLNVDGNSIFWGYQCTHPWNYYLTLPATRAIQGNYAVSGETSEWLASSGHFPAFAAMPRSQRRVYICMEIANSIYHVPDNDVAAFNAYRQLCLQHRAIGERVIAVTPTQFNFAASSWGQTQGQAYLTSAASMIRNGWPSFADDFVDLYNATGFGYASSYFQADYMHWNDAGQAAAAPLLQPAIVRQAAY